MIISGLDKKKKQTYLITDRLPFSDWLATTLPCMTETWLNDEQVK